MKNISLLAFCMMLMVSAIAQAPSANFSSNVTEGCSPLVIDFTDQSTGNPTSWIWDFGNGATSTLKNPSTSYFNPGTYTVTLKATNAGGSNTITKTAYITIYEQPVVNFSAPVLSGCTPLQVQFADQSSTPSGTAIMSWSWTFGDGGTSTLQNPSYYYKTPGNYTVTLTVQTNKGCTKSLTKPYYVNATDGVKPSFTYTDPDVCSAPATVSFTNTSTGPGNLTYSWNFGNGNTSTSQNTSTTYNSNGNYKVTLFVTSDMGCADSASHTVIVGKATTDFTVPTNICPGQPVQFTNNSTPRPISAKWAFSNGTTDNLINGMTTFQTPGTYTVTLINTYAACTDTLTKTITTSAIPNIQFSVSDTGKCQAPFTVNFTNGSNGTSYKWDFGDSTTSTQTNPSHTYTRDGDFTVTLVATGSNGCTDTLRKPALIHVGRPKIAFTTLPAKGCIPLTVNFAASIRSADAITSYNWNFGNGNTSTSQSPTYTYTAEGVYNVSLTVTTSTGCTETYSMTDAVKAGTKPTADFTSDITTACANPGIQFTNLSTNANEYLWEFSDGSTSPQKDPKQTFQDTGWIDVKMTALNKGCATEVIKTKYAYIQPSVSKFSYTPSCSNPLQYTFSDQSIGANTWSWNFGDGTTFTGKTPPPHTFPGAGVYTVTLVTTNNSCTYSASRTITIKDKTPDFSPTASTGCKPLGVTFNLAPDDGTIKEYHWNFGEGPVQIYVHGGYSYYTYANAGTYTVSVTAVDTFGCTFTRTKTNIVTVSGPKANFTSTTNRGCKGAVTTFIDSTITSGGANIVSWKFNFGDGSVQTFTAPPFQHTYDSLGDFDVKMVVTDSNGCSDSITLREFVKISTLKADWSTTGFICPNAPLAFSDNSTSDYPLTYTWNFGDGGTSSAGNTYHAYADTGLYTVTLKIKDIVGCEDSLTKAGAVLVRRPKADFTANNLVSFCTPFEAKFENRSTFYESTLWDLSNAMSTTEHPVNYYQSTGTYNIKLLITAPGGCKDSITKQLEVYNPNDGTLTYNTSPDCRPKTVTFTAFRPMNGRFIWDFGDGNVIDTTSNTMTHVYQNFGKFIPKVILKQSEGCIVPLTGKDTIEVFGAEAKFAIDKYFFCDSGTVNIIDSTTSNGVITRYSMDFGDGTVVNQPAASHLYTTPGSYFITLIVETQGGCTDTMRLPNPVRVIKRPDVSVNGDAVICTNESMQLSGILNQPDTSAVKWNWQFPNGNSSGLQNPPAQNYTPGTYTVITKVVNSSGCTDSVSTPITIHSLPVITLPATITKNVGTTITIPAQYSSGVTSYLWTPATSLSCTNCPQPVASTKFSTNYIVSVVDSNGCTDSSMIRVIVLCEGATIFFPNAFSPNGDGSNDVFYPRGSGLDRVKSVRLFNRWGEVVFEQKDFPVNNAAYGWDGKYKGKPPQPGVYIFQAEIFCENGEVIRIEGNVALIQ